MKTLVSLLAGVSLCAAAFADSAPAVTSTTFNAAGVAVEHAAPSATAARPAALPLSRGTLIYSNFNTDKTNLYDCCNGYTVRGNDVGLGYQRTAMPFTPTTDTHLRQVVIGMSTAGGFNRMMGTLQADDNGLPGDVISEVVIGGFPALGTCCTTETIPGQAIPLQAGKTYWIVATPRNLSALAWSHTNTGEVGPGAFDAGNGWETFTDLQGAFAVFGD